MNKYFLIFLILGSLILYGSFLNFTPVHLNQDELGFALNAYSIAQSGIDENGRFLPFYFWHLDLMWSTPVIVYLTAVFLKFFPLSEGIIRLPSVLVGLINITLVYLISKEIFKTKQLSLITTLFLVLNPTHFIHSRFLLDNLYILPFALGWLYFLILFLKKKKTKFLIYSSLCLGFGVHSYHAAKITMPLYFLATILVIFTVKSNFKRNLFTSLIFFILPLLPFIWWLPKYPDTLTDQVKYVGLYNTNLSPLQGLISVLTPEGIMNRVAVYLDYFNPKFLFLTGDSSLIHSTQRIGIFLYPFILLLPLGVYYALKQKDKVSKLIIYGFLTAPIAPSFVLNPDRVSKELVILPFACLLSGYGLSMLIRIFPKYLKYIIIILIVFITTQFPIFLYDYYTDYRTRSYAWFNYNIPGVLEELIKLDRIHSPEKIYLDNKSYFIDRYWQFFLIKHNVLNLSYKTEFFSENTDLEQIPKGSLLEHRFDNQITKESSVESYEKLKEILEPDGFKSFFIIKK